MSDPTWPGRPLPGDAPLVSVIMLTYNHAAHVRQAIESALGQAGRFRLELLVADDASSDATPAIVRDLATTDQRVRPILRARNVGMHRNFRGAWERCRGEYIAILEGDDYWVGEGKLDEQISTMNGDPGSTMCFHAVLALGPDGQVDHRLPPSDDATFSLERLIRGNFIHTCSVVYRTGVVPSYPTWFDDLRMGDWPLHLLHASAGSIAYVPETYGVYRMHASGSWSPETEEVRVRESARVLESFARHADVIGSTRRRALRQANKYRRAAARMAVRRHADLGAAVDLLGPTVPNAYRSMAAWAGRGS